MSLAGQQHIVDVIQDGGLFPGWYAHYDLFQDGGVSFPGLRVPVTNSRPEALEPFADALGTVLRPVLDLELDIAASSGIPLDALDIRSQWGVTARAVRDGLTARKLPGGRTPSTGYLSSLAIEPIAVTNAKPEIRNLTSLNGGEYPINEPVERTQLAFQMVASITGSAALRRCGLTMQLRKNIAQTIDPKSRYLLLSKVVRY